jgi:hypothetical protein
MRRTSYAQNHHRLVFPMRCHSVGVTGGHTHKKVELPRQRRESSNAVARPSVSSADVAPHTRCLHSNSCMPQLRIAHSVTSAHRTQHGTLSTTRQEGFSSFVEACQQDLVSTNRVISNTFVPTFLSALLLENLPSLCVLIMCVTYLMRSVVGPMRSR